MGRIYRNIGFAGLWNGVSVRIVMIGTLTAFQWLIYDSFKVQLGVCVLNVSLTSSMADKALSAASDDGRPLVPQFTDTEMRALTGKHNAPIDQFLDRKICLGIAMTLGDKILKINGLEIQRERAVRVGSRTPRNAGHDMCWFKTALDDHFNGPLRATGPELRGALARFGTHWNLINITIMTTAVRVQRLHTVLMLMPFLCTFIPTSSHFARSASSFEAQPEQAHPCNAMQSCICS